MKRARSSKLLGLVVGSSLLHSNLFDDLKDLELETLAGTVIVKQGNVETHSIVVIQRHKPLVGGEYYQPHRIPYGAIAEAFTTLGVTTVIGFQSVGSLQMSIEPGTFVVPDDYFNIWNVQSAITTQQAHISPGYSEDVRSLILEHVSASQQKHIAQAVYVQCRGPRFETKAEIRFIRSLGDIVGMTGASEATFFKEAGLEYGQVCMVDNYANGMLDTPLTLQEFRKLSKANESIVEQLAKHIIDKWTNP